MLLNKIFSQFSLTRIIVKFSKFKNTQHDDFKVRNKSHQQSAALPRKPVAVDSRVR